MSFFGPLLDPATLPDPKQVATPLFILFVLIELTLVHRRRLKGDYETRDTLTSLIMGTGSVLGGVLLGGLGYLCLLGAYDMRLTTIQTTPLSLFLLFLLDDMRFYWGHRFSHRIRWFWADHVIHHSSQHYNLSTALRQPWLSGISGMFLLQTPLALIGFHPAALAFVGALNLVYQFWIHTEAVGRFPRWFEAVFNTPSHHRVHHARNAKYLDANYAGTLIVWDRLFGSFIPEDDAEPAEYGLVKNLGTFNPLRVATHEYVGILKDVAQRGLTIRQRLAYFFAPPGWSHDGSRMTSDELKRRDEERKKQNEKIAVRAAD
ncbi:sterol desaturase family protein [Parvibaculum sp. MBR-TMA-1.3b-4.2]|jgi:sterol desaturase/sphingolipid hydroxylase (fatty acid hydroxylase superfamily)